MDKLASCLPISDMMAWMAINGMEMGEEVRGRGETVLLGGQEGQC